MSAIPGVVGTDSILYLSLPTITIPATGSYTYKYMITIDGLSLSSSLSNCTVSWAVTTMPASPVPNCAVAVSGIIDINNMPV